MELVDTVSDMAYMDHLGSFVIEIGITRYC